MQILGQENRTGLALLGEAWSVSSSMFQEAGRQQVRLPRNCRENPTEGRQAWGSHLAKGKNGQHKEGQLPLRREQKQKGAVYPRNSLALC